MSGGLGERLRTARETAGLSQTDAAQALGVKQQQISSWESGTMPPSRHHHRLVDLYCLAPEDFYRWVADAHRLRADRAQHQATDQRRQREFIVDKIGSFIEQYEELGHTYRSMATDVATLVERALPLQAIFEEIKEQLARLEERHARLEERLPPSPPPDRP